MLVDVYLVAAVVATGEVGEGGAAVGGPEDVEGIEEQGLGVVGVDSHALVVPVLGVIGRAAGKATHARALLPGRATVGGAPHAELPTALLAATGEDGLHLSVNVVGVAGGHGQVDAAQGVAAGLVDGGAATGAGGPAVVGAAGEGPGGGAAAGGHCAL